MAVFGILSCLVCLEGDVDPAPGLPLADVPALRTGLGDATLQDPPEGHLGIHTLRSGVNRSISEYHLQTQ